VTRPAEKHQPCEGASLNRSPSSSYQTTFIMSTEKPFKISIPDADLSLLKQKLALVRFPDELQDLEDEWDYGVPLKDIKRLVARWKDGYDWRRHEDDINRNLPMFTRDIDIEGEGTLSIHYAHQKSKNANAIPLLFVHGWPGHFLEGRKLIALLTSPPPDSGAPSFHFVTLSLPGYGFSEAPKKRGFGVSQYAETAHKLMLALGYNEYVTQGGDWGYFITSKMATVYGPKHVKAWHTNFPLGKQPSLIWNPLLFAQQLMEIRNPVVQKRIARSQWVRDKGQGYMREQSTQPQTLGYSLADSPVGLLGWIYEKLHHWTDAYPWEDDEVLDWITLYWLSRAGPAASLRIYYEVVQGGQLNSDTATYISTPQGLSYFPQEMYAVPKSWVQTTRNLVFVSEHPQGGHFAAYEQPDRLAEDLRKMFGKGGPVFGVVKGLDGY